MVLESGAQDTARNEVALSDSITSSVARGAWEAHRFAVFMLMFSRARALPAQPPSGRGMAAEEPTDAMLRDLPYAAAIAELTARASLANRGK